ncbi:hypothetical protein Ahia01_000311700 [Argonauta hians]
MRKISNNETVLLENKTGKAFGTIDEICQELDGILTKTKLKRSQRYCITIAKLVIRINEVSSCHTHKSWHRTDEADGKRHAHNGMKHPNSNGIEQAGLMIGALHEPTYNESRQLGVNH